MRSKRLLAMRGDEYLVAQIRGGEEAAFEVALERHGPAILSFCRHMLGSREEAEDALQQAFASAYRDLLRDGRPIQLKPWLFTIARNRCLSMLRARREQPAELQEIATIGLAEQVEHRAELRELVEDLRDLPEEQRAALLLAEAGDLAHTEVADVLDCEVPRVKALVFRARSGLIERRDARHAPCEEIRGQLANLRGGSLRRSELRHHLRVCPGCREYREQVRSQRRMLAAVLPVTPSLGLKSSVLGAIGLGGGAGGAGLLPMGGAAVAKLCAAGALLGGGAVAGEALMHTPERAPAGDVPAAAAVKPQLEEAEAAPAPAAERAAGRDERVGSRTRARRQRAEQRRRAARRAKEKRARGGVGGPGARGPASTKAKPPKAAPGPRSERQAGSKPPVPPKRGTLTPSLDDPAAGTQPRARALPEREPAKQERLELPGE